MTFRDQIREDLVVTDFYGMFSAISVAIARQAAAPKPEPEPQAADAPAAATAASMRDAREQVDAWQRSNRDGVDDGLLD